MGKKLWVAVLGAIFVFLSGVGLSAENDQTSRDTYTWFGELESVDATAKTITVKSRVAYADAFAALQQFKPGENVVVLWSGGDDSADAVRQVRKADAASKVQEAFALPAVLVGTDAPSQYMTMRVGVPDGGLAAISNLKPGEWITVTSRHRPSTGAEAIVAVRPYNAVTAKTS